MFLTAEEKQVLAAIGETVCTKAWIAYNLNWTRKRVDIVIRRLKKMGIVECNGIGWKRVKGK